MKKNYDTRKLTTEINPIKKTVWKLALSATFIFFAFTSHLFAQPGLSYNTPQNYTVDIPITPLVPGSSGVSTYGYGVPAPFGSGFFTPYGVAVGGGSGNVYISSSSGVYDFPFNVTLNAPQYMLSGSNSPEGIALDASGNLYVAYAGNNTVIRYNGSTIQSLGSGFNHPSGVAVDAAGIIYVSDQGNNAIKKIEAAGFITTTISTAFNSPTALALDGYGNIYVSDNGTNSVKEILATNGNIITLARGLSSPQGLAVDAAGNVLVCDNVSNTITEIPSGGGTPLVIVSGLVNPTGVAFDQGGTIDVADGSSSKTIKIINPIGGYFLSNLLPIGLSFNNNTGVISGTPTGGSSRQNYDVEAYNADGGTYAYFTLIVDSQALPTIKYQTPNTYFVDTFAKALSPTSSNVAAYGAFFGYNLNVSQLATGFTQPYGIAVDTADNVYLADTENKRVVKIPKGGGTPVAIGSGFNHPTGVAVDSAGNVYVADNSIYKIPANGSAQVTILANLNAYAISIDRNGNLYTCAGYGFVYKIPAGSSTLLQLATFQDPVSVAADGAGNVYIGDGETSTVYEITSGGKFRIIGGGPFLTPSCVTVDAAGNVFYATSGADFGSIYEIPNNGGPSFALTVNLLQPYSLVIDQKGNILATDWNGRQAGGATVNEITPTGGYFLSTPLPVGMDFNNSTGVIDGKPTAVSPATNYTVTGYNNLGSISATVNIRTILDAGDNLSNLQLSAGPGNLSPVFAVGTTAYTDTVGNTVTSITATPTVLDNGETVTVNGVTVASGSPSAAIPLVVGNNTVTTVVTATDGKTTNTYTVNVVRRAPNSARLAFLELSGILFTPQFALNTTAYSASVTYYVTSTTVTPTTVDPLATITVNGVPVASGKASPPVNLNAGLNPITVTVTAEDGVTTDTYTINVTRAGNPGTRLGNLVVTGATISPAFDINTTEYSATVSNATTSITIRPVNIYVGETIAINNTPVTSGATVPYQLAVGPNTFDIVVTAQNGINTETYTVTVTREGATPGALNRLFDPATAISVNSANNALQTINNDGILVHQGLSPNGDGINDFLRIDGIAGYPENKLLIMDRNGQLIFESKNYDNSNKVFDGHSSKTGAMQLPGTYFYSLDYMVKGIVKHQTGFIVLKY